MPALIPPLQELQKARARLHPTAHTRGPDRTTAQESATAASARASSITSATVARTPSSAARTARHATWGRVPCSYARLEQPVKQRPRSREIGRGAVGSPCASPASSRREPFPRSRSPEITRDHPRDHPRPSRDHPEITPRSPRDHPRSPAAVGRAANRPPLRAACLAGGCARPAMGRTCPRHIHDTSNRSGRACLRAWSRRARARSWRRQVLAYPG